ncbi:MAG: hypothetical protein DHS20C07_31350 [Methyloligella sp.]|nr:MAG: hypothetical protein DHS20C07_31350 [Methyloligella sp.]
MNKKSFAGRVGSKGREQVSNPNLVVDLDALTPKPTTTTPSIEQPKRHRGGVKPIQNDRIGKQSLNVYLDKNVKKQFAMLSIELEKNQTELLIEALNELFKKYNKPPIA